MQFKIHIHDDLRARWAGRDIKTELRNSMARHLKRRFGGNPPAFFFVIEDITKDGRPTRPHAHGSIDLREVDLPKHGEGSRLLPRLALVNEKKARLEAGKLKIKEALWASSGGREPRIALTSRLDQVRNVWLRKPYHPIFNSQWVDYAFKNAKEFSNTLGEGRLAMHQPLLQEARRFWHLIREGEAAMHEWDGV